ncbi:hypothetical protein [Velocimicrobium porci]|nr:hypothetical protein [Velocimicrobium porci]
MNEISNTILFLLGVTILIFLFHSTEETINCIRYNLYHGTCVMYEEEIG